MHVFRYDPAKRDLFLQYPNGTLYSHGSYPDGIGMMLFWNYSNPAAADYVVDSILSTVNNSDVDGTFTDDSAYVRRLRHDFGYFGQNVLGKWTLVAGAGRSTDDRAEDLCNPTTSK